jgi:serine/threonine protein kinase
VTQVRQILDEYRLEAVLRTTVHTTVFKAAVPSTSKPVVIKLVNPPGSEVDEATRTRFLTTLLEAQGSSVRALPRILDFGFTPEGNAFVVSELVQESATLLSALRGEPPERLVPILVALLDAADELAIAGFHHLNLSPDNVLVTERGVRLLGFGTAAYLSGAPSGLWPPQGDRYAAPELFGSGILQRDDLWLADLYAVALITCDLLGVVVENPGTAEPVVRVRGSDSDVCREFESVVAMSLRTDPGTRSVSFSEFRRVLAQAEFPIVDRSEDAFDDALRRVSEVVGGVVDGGPKSAEEDSATVVIPTPKPAPRPARSAASVPSSAIPKPQRAPAPAAIPVVDRADESGADPYADTKPSRRTTRELPRFPWALVLIALAAAAAFAVVSSVLIGSTLGRRKPDVEPVVLLPVPTPVPTPVPIDEPPAVHPLLEQAQQRLAEADLQGARVALEALSDADVELFSDVERQIFEQFIDLLEPEEDHTAALEDLRSGLQQGSIRMLRRGVAGVGSLSMDEIRAEPGLQQDLDKARAALRVHQELWDSSKAGDHLAVIEHADRMVALLPKYSGAYQLRDEAAGAIEAAAETSIERREFEDAERRLESLHRLWPDREGLVERIEWCRQQETTDRQMQATLERALKAGAGGDPEAGLKQLAATTPSGNFTQRFADARRILEGQLATLDANAPELELPPDFAPEFRKKETLVVPITVTDDYRVERVVVFVRSAGDADFREITLRSADGVVYEFEVTPEIHDRGDVAFYAIAEDRSGHQGRLGSAERPLLLERKRWYKR